MSGRRMAIGALLAAAAVLAGCSDTTPPVAAAGTLADSADQVLSVVRVALHNEGLQRGRLTADTAFVFDEGTRFEMVNVHVTFFNDIGAPNGTLTSREGTYNTRAGSMEARGNVVVTNPLGRRLESPQLRYDQALDEISSDSAFVATEPDGRRIEGVGFTSDPDLNNIRIRKTTGAIGGAFVIPNQ